MGKDTLDKAINKSMDDPADQKRAECIIKEFGGILEHVNLTLAVADEHEELKFYHFSNEADMIYSIVLGMKSKQIRSKYNIGADEPIKDKLQVEDLTIIEALQDEAVRLIESGYTYRQRKVKLAEARLALMADGTIYEIWEEIGGGIAYKKLEVTTEDPLQYMHDCAVDGKKYRFQNPALDDDLTAYMK